MRNLKKIPKNPIFLVLSLPNLILGTIFLIYLLTVVVFVLRYNSLFSSENKNLFVFAIPVFVFSIFIALANIFNFYLILLKKKIFPVLCILPLILISYISLAFVMIFYSIPNFSFAQKCESINGKPFTLETIKLLGGFCSDFKDGKAISRECTTKDLQNYSPNDFGLPVLEENKWDSQFSCFVKPSNQGSITRVSYQFD